MIERVRFFVASLWAALVPVAMMVMACTAVALIPAAGTLANVKPHAAGVALILVPFAYTAMVVASYLIGRALYHLHVLSRMVLLCAYGALSLLCAVLFSWSSDLLGYATGASLPAFFIFLGSTLIGLGTAAVVWWRVASDVPAPSVKEAARLERHRLRRERRRSELEEIQRSKPGGTMKDEG
jgi:hypothetical protein